MTTQPAVPERFSFGPFEVDTALGELRREGIRLRLAGQPFRILLALVARPGELVTREELSAEVWEESTFVDFEHGLNAAVNKLRRALGDGAENPRYIETYPGRGYRFIGTLRDAAAAQGSKQPEPVVVSLPLVKRGSTWWWLGVAAVVGVISVAVVWQTRDRNEPSSPWKLTRLTTGMAFSDGPTISHDGKLVAYSSDRGPAGEREIYVQQIGGGEPIQITHDGGTKYSPDFSPDGSVIAFRSDRDGGGIWEVPALGGEARFLAKHGYNPKFSPDGTQIAFWVGDDNVTTSVPGSSEVWVVAASGGEPRHVGAKFTSARRPIWAPDGKHLLMVGYTSKTGLDRSAIDWWLVATDGDSAARTGLFGALQRAEVQAHDLPTTPFATMPNPPAPGCWLAGTNRVIFSVRNGYTRSLWETGISPETGRVDGAFKRLTTGTGNEAEPSCSSPDSLVFTNVESRGQLWTTQLNAFEGKTQGPFEPVQDDTQAEEPSLSEDGRLIAFSSPRSGILNIWMRDSTTGAVSHIANSSLAQRFPSISPSGKKVAYSVFEPGKRTIYLWKPGGPPEKLCEGCIRPAGWSRDESSLLVFGGTPYQVDLIDIASRQKTLVLKDPRYNLLFARFSPDGHWISFTVRVKSNRSLIAIAPLDGPKPVPESAWIKIADGEPEDRAEWSPDGRMLYYTSPRDGHTCFWAQRIDLTSHKPIGEPFVVEHFHGHVTYSQAGWSTSRKNMVVGLVDGSENIWTMSRTSRP